MKFLTISLILIGLGLSGSLAQEDPLKGRSWAKYIIPKTGMYRIRAADARNNGLGEIPVDRLQVRTLRGGLLPQAIDAGAADIISEIPVQVIDDGDGIFNNNDELIFFAEGPDVLRYSPEGLIYQYNFYHRENYIFVGEGDSPGKRVGNRTAPEASGTEVNTYLHALAHETTLNNLLSSGRNWYGERFDAVLQRDFVFSVPDAVPGGEIRLTSKVMAQSFGTARFRLFVNSTLAGEQQIDPVPDFLNPPSNNPFRYAVKGRERSDTFIVPAGSETVTVRAEFEKAAAALSVGYLDHLIVEVPAEIRLSGDQTLIQGMYETEGGHATIRAEVPAGSIIWDVTDLFAVKQVSDFTREGEVITFSDSTRSDRRFIFFNPGSIPEAGFSGLSSSSGLTSGNPEMIIIAPPEFMQAAERLASFRATNDGMNVMTVSTSEVFDVFGSGRRDISAIRNLARYHYSGGSLKYLLLFGKGSYDYLNVLPFRADFVPAYQSRISLDPLSTFVSDDYFGFLEPGEGEWIEEAGGNHSLDIGVGRLPVTSAQEANTVVDKIISYQNASAGLGDWRSRLLFIADDEDFNLHHRQADDLARLVDEQVITLQNKRLFLGSFRQSTTGGGEAAPEATEAILREIRRGALIVNYTGHGNESSWMQEQVFTTAMISTLQNRERLPLFITATCEFGRHDDPRQISGAEQLVKEPIGGGIAILSTCRPVFSSSNFNLNEAFYNALIEEGISAGGRLGDIMRITKNNSVDLASDSRKVGNRNFTLLGDPSLRLVYPTKEIQLERIIVEGMESDTLRAGSLVRLEGRIAGDPAFSGKVDIRVKDKAAEAQTIQSPLYAYEERLNTLFSGSATVINGQFSASFIVPRNISNKEGTGQIFMYAEDGLNDAIGATREVYVSGSSTSSGDENGPEIMIYFGDSTNTSREDVNHNTLVYVRLRDESGINTSGFGIGNNLSASIDGQPPIILNDYYGSDTDTYRSGWVIFPLNDLSEGEHTLTFEAFDVFNNSGRTTVVFDVADPGTLIVRELKNYPNPFRESTSISFTHNRAGEDLDIWVTIMNRNGQIVSETRFLASRSEGRVILSGDETGGYTKNLSPGIYVYGVRVRSRLDGAADVKYQKLIVIN